MIDTSVKVLGWIEGRADRATRPSIMSEGAMMSAPASASTSAWRVSTATVRREDDAVAQQPVMAMAGVGIERDVAEDADLRHGLLDGADGAADEIVGLRASVRPRRRKIRIGVGKQREAGNA